LIQNNVNDTWFPVSGYDRIVREVGEVYRTLGAEGRFVAEARITHHDITDEFGARMIEWFGRWV
jgi:hypothetical protein